MRTFIGLVFLVLLAIATAAITKDGNVLVLDDKNWEEAVAAHKQLLVEFYAPWCGHCKTLAPEWTKAADTLEGSTAVLAKVDATEAKALATQFGITGFPTIKYFNNGKPSEYSGGRTAKDIVSWVNKKTLPAAATITTAAELDALKAKGGAIVLGAFSSTTSENAVAFFAAAAGSEDDDLTFVITEAEDVRSSLAVSEDTIVVLRTFDEPRVDHTVGTWDDEAVAMFISSETTPAVMEFSQASSKKIFSSPVSKHALFFSSKAASHHANIMSIANDVAKNHKGSILCVNVPSNSDNKRVLDYFGLTEESLPALIFADMSANMKKYPFSGEFTSENVNAFASDLMSGILKPTLKSEEPVPADQTGDVIVVKGKSFNEIVIDNDKDVLVEFYAPWCGHCKSLAPTWEKLGQKYKGSKIVIAKMDATANEIDVEGINIQGFPTIYWLRGDAKTAPQPYEGGRDFDAFVNFIEENAHNADHDEL